MSQITLVVRRTIKADVRRVFDAWTKPEQLVRWWGPRPVTCREAVIDLRAGGEYRIANAMPDGTTLWIFGEFELVEPPSRLIYSWQTGAGPEALAGASRVTVRFEPRSGGTEVIVLHERIDTEATRTEHEGGWNGCLESLAGVFENA
jgi:uncharacterized protein YndB with AHSA1/START domain